MSDHIWEDEVEPGFQAAKWVLEKLRHDLDTLDDNGCGNRDEFKIARDELRGLINELITIRDKCQDRREK